MTEEAFEPASGKHFGCPACGGSIFYDIPGRALVCRQCGRKTAPEELPDEAGGEDTMEGIAYRCPQCGAEIYTSRDTEATGHCIFCGSDVVLQGRLARFRRPEKLVPFRITREECGKIYRKHLSRYLLAPASLKRSAVVEDFQPVYVPYWQYAIRAEGMTDGYAGYLTVKDSQQRIHEKYRIMTDVSVNTVCSELFDASDELEDETGRRLDFSPYGSIPFHSAYLSGFMAQGADVSPESAQKDAKAYVSAQLMKYLERACRPNMDIVDIRPTDRLTDLNWRDDWGLPNSQWDAQITMMPVWLLTRRSEGRVLYTAVNGVNGNIVCDPPVSHARMAAVVLTLTALLSAALQMFLSLRANLTAVLCGVLALIFHMLMVSGVLGTVRRESGPGKGQDEGSRMLAQVKDFARYEESVYKEKDVGYYIPEIVISLLMLFFLWLPSWGINTYAIFGHENLLFGLITAICLAVLILCHVRRKRPTGIQAVFRYILFGLYAVLIGLFVLRRFEDMMYYGCAAAFLLCNIVPMVYMNLQHNRYVTRPVPFFGKREAEA